MDDTGSAFAMGCVGGAIWHGIKGLRDAPRGERLLGARDSMRLRAPVLGGNFAVWGLSFSIFDCAFAHIRKKEDPFNAIASGFMTGGVLAMRAGWKAAGKNAVIGGVLLAMIEGLGIMVGRAFPMPDQMAAPDPYQQQGSNSGLTAPPVVEQYSEDFDNEVADTDNADEMGLGFEFASWSDDDITDDFSDDDKFS